MEAFAEIENAYKEIEDEIIRSVDSLCDGNYLKIKDEVIMPLMSDSLIEKIIILNRHINDNSNPEEFEKKVTNEKVMQINDKLIYLLCDYYINKEDIDNLINFTTSNENYFSVLPQAKTAKLIRNIVEKISKKIRNISTLYIIFKKYMNWAYEKKRNFLRCRIEVKIIILFILKQKYKTALSLIERLLKEVKKVDDKALLLELYIVETKIYMLLKNSTKMKASLTFAKNIANTINTAIYINSEIDLLSGILYIYEKDYRSAYIYLYECYETLYTYIYNSQNNTLDFLSKKHNDFYSVIIHNIINTSTISSQNRTKSISQISPFLLSFYTFYEYYDCSNSLLNVDEMNLLSNN
ncbi:26S proteasome regulatory subunit RPN6, putative (RPN6), partial [Plasmodium ovale curtisi]